MFKNAASCSEDDMVNQLSLRSHKHMDFFRSKSYQAQQFERRICFRFDSLHVVGNKRTALATNQHDVTVAGGTYDVILTTTIFHHWF